MTHKNSTTNPTKDRRRNGLTRQRDHAQVEAARAPFAPVPRKLATDPTCSAEAVRLWAVLDGLAIERVPPEIPIIAERMATMRANGERKLASQASIYRWAGELEAAGWLEWDRRADRAERWKLCDGGPEAEEIRSMRRIRAVLATHRNAESALEAIVAILTGENPSLISENHILTDESPTRSDENPFLTGENTIRTNENPSIYRDSGKRSETATDNPPTHPVVDVAASPTSAYLASLGIVTAERFAGLDLAAVKERVEQMQRDPKCQLSFIVRSLSMSPPQARSVGADGPIDTKRYTSGEYEGMFQSGDDEDEEDEESQ